jgi:hypothetical protein
VSAPPAPNRSLSDILSTNTESRSWTAAEWRAAFQRLKEHPGHTPPPYIVVSPAEFHRRVVAGEIDIDGYPLPLAGREPEDATNA